jgi:hypothetical protein
MTADSYRNIDLSGQRPVGSYEENKKTENKRLKITEK